MEKAQQQQQSDRATGMDQDGYDDHDERDDIYGDVEDEDDHGQYVEDAPTSNV